MSQFDLTWFQWNRMSIISFSNSISSEKIKMPRWSIPTRKKSFKSLEDFDLKVAIEIFHVSTLSKHVELRGTSELSERFEYKIPDSSCMQNRKTNRVKMELGVCRAIILGSYWFLLCSEACWNNLSCREYTPLAGNRRKTILDRNIIKQES